MDRGLHTELSFDLPITECIKNVSMTIPGRVAISFYGRDISYRELWDNTIKIGGSLRKIGVKKGDTVVLFMQNCPQFVISSLAVLHIGGVAVPVNPMLKQEELRHLLDDCKPALIICDDHLVSEIPKELAKHIVVTALSDFAGPLFPVSVKQGLETSREVAGETLQLSKLLQYSGNNDETGISDLSQDAVLVYTGGTTGLPKAAINTHHALTWGAVTSGQCYGFSNKDVILVVLPLFHSFGLLNVMCAPLVFGCQLVILSRFDEETAFSAISQYGITTWFTVATMMTRVVDAPMISKYDLSSLRLINYGAMPMSSSLRKRIKERFPKAIVQEGYGLAEVLGYGIVQEIPGSEKEGYTGKPTTGTEIKVVDLETGTKALPPNQEGEIVVKCPSVMKGYWNRPEETAEVLKEGWLHTGDIGKTDEEGFIALVGRKKEVIKASGFSVFPTEIENILCKHPAVAEACVVGVPDEVRGQIPKAFVILKPEYKEKIAPNEIAGWLRQNMAAYKQPGMLVFRDSLPKSGAGKVLRRVLLAEES